VAFYAGLLGNALWLLLAVVLVSPVLAEATEEAEFEYWMALPDPQYMGWQGLVNAAWRDDSDDYQSFGLALFQQDPLDQYRYHVFDASADIDAEYYQLSTRNSWVPA
jgi:hypothetical protein